MKKTVILLIILTTAVTSVFLYGKFFKRHRGAARLFKAGVQAENFILGMKNSRVYRLYDIIGNEPVILSFTFNNSQSNSFKELFSLKFPGFISNNPGILWFNIHKSGNHAIIEEMTKKIGLKHRTLYKNIPYRENITNKVTVILIGKHGIIRMFYLGYSPTVFTDISNSLGGGIPE